MGSVFYVIAIMGCGDGQSACAQQRVDSGHYASAAQCQAAMPAVLARNNDLDYPTIAGSCRQIGQSMADRAAKATRG